jgi:hypothetical protein
MRAEVGAARVLGNRIARPQPPIESSANADQRGCGGKFQRQTPARTQRRRSSDGSNCANSGIASTPHAKRREWAPLQVRVSSFAHAMVTIRTTGLTVD